MKILVCNYIIKQREFQFVIILLNNEKLQFVIINHQHNITFLTRIASDYSKQVILGRLLACLGGFHSFYSFRSFIEFKVGVF